MLPILTLSFDDSHDYVIGVSENSHFPILVFVETDLDTWTQVRTITSDEGGFSF